ncbi:MULTISPECIES: hypothetical protein [unclassified Acinetobacter]|uniref:hypothetical protein n=1 Tax=unclassified Acinetobacter TaxID=196816 RepID=UPI00051B9C1C|nr:hypothetical protein [Acinetobacter sp. MN12]
MQDIIELLKIAIESSSPTFIFTIFILAIVFKSKNILYGILEFKDLTKKRLIQKHEEAARFNDKNFLTSQLNKDYLRLCEESQIKALIGCRFCSKEMALFILSRKDISSTIILYHRVKAEIEIINGNIVPKNKMNEFRIKFNIFFGFIFYMILSMLAFSPLLLPMFSDLLFKHPIALNLDWKIVLATGFFMIVIFSTALFILNESLKPRFTKRFCDLNPEEEIESHIDL